VLVLPISRTGMFNDRMSVFAEATSEAVGHLITAQNWNR
jgi:hypothetical protein